MKEVGGYVSVGDGTQISVLLELPDGEPKAVVQLQGGGGLKKEFYKYFAQHLAENGYAVVLLDYRGIGGSIHDFLTTKEADLLDWARLDMTGVFRWTQKQFPGIPRFLIGHSIGGIFSGFVEGLIDAKGLVLLCACSGDWRRMAFPYRILPGFIFNIFVPLVARVSPKIPLRYSGVMDDLPRGVGKSWRQLAINRNFLRKHIGSGSTYYEKYTGPLLSVMVEDDPIATESISRELHSYFERSEAEFWKISPRDTGRKRIGHFGIFSRRFKDGLWRDITRWLDERLE